MLENFPKDDRFPNKGYIPVVHTGLYYVIECTFAEAKEKGVNYRKDMCFDTNENDKGIITYWLGEEIWIPYSVTKNDTFTLLTEDKQGNKYDFESITLDVNRTKIDNVEFCVKQYLQLGGKINTPDGNVIDIVEEAFRRSTEPAYNLNEQYLQVKLVAGTECEFAKAAKFNLPGAYKEIGYKDDQPGDIIFSERGPVWIPKNQSWGTLRKLEKSNKEELICAINIKDFELKENNGVINIDFHRIDTSQSNANINESSNNELIF